MLVLRVGPFPPLDPVVRAESLARTIAGHTGEIWVFGYGSLMWDSELPFSERKPAILHDFRRLFCIWTAHARGTPEQPGLALGLLPTVGEQCNGVALKVDKSRADAALTALWDREMWTDIYRPVWRKLATPQGMLDAIVFEVNTASQQFAGELSLQEMEQNIAKAVGVFGTCRDYLFDTAQSLQRGGVNSEEFRELCDTVERLKVAC